jgi:hypothetical protein
MAPENSASICRMKCSPSLSSFSFASGIDKTSQTSTLPTARELFAAAAASHDSLPDLALPQAVPGGVSLFHSYASHSVKGFARFGHKQINQDALLHCAHTDVNQHCGSLHFFSPSLRSGFNLIVSYVENRFVWLLCGYGRTRQARSRCQSLSAALFAEFAVELLVHHVNTACTEQDYEACVSLSGSLDD